MRSAEVALPGPRRYGTRSDQPVKKSKPCKNAGEDIKHQKRLAPHPGPRCATCWRAEVKRRKEAAHRAMTAKVYDTDTDFYDLLYAFQNGLCWICRLATGATKRLANDHDHKTDLLRGLLCGECNQFLGRRVRDNPDVGLRIFWYLINPPARQLCEQLGRSYEHNGRTGVTITVPTQIAPDGLSYDFAVPRQIR